MLFDFKGNKSIITVIKKKKEEKRAEEQRKRLHILWRVLFKARYA